MIDGKTIFAKMTGAAPGFSGCESRWDTRRILVLGPRDPEPGTPPPDRPDPFEPARPAEIPEPSRQPDLPQPAPDEVPLPREPANVPRPAEVPPYTDPDSRLGRPGMPPSTATPSSARWHAVRRLMLRRLILRR